MTHASVTFDQMYDCLLENGPAKVVSSKDTPYAVEAKSVDGTPTIIGQLPSGKASDTVRIHADCWGQDKTCAGTRTGGLLNGDPSLYDWYAKTCGKSNKGSKGSKGSSKGNKGKGS